MAFECGQALSLGVSGCKQMARLGHHRIGCDVEQFVQLVSWARSTKAGHAHKAAVDAKVSIPALAHGSLDGL